ncbi:MAG: ABC transporter permease [Huintestinicola sp.]
MSKLLSANLSRLFKSKAFYITALITLVLTVFLVLMDCNTSAKYELEKNFEGIYFCIPPYFGLVISTFTAMFIGTEYSDLTLRNKIVIGHSRAEVFFANLLTCIAASVIFFIIWAISGCVGIPYFGLESIDMSACLSKLLVTFFSVISLSAVFGTISQLISSKATGAVAGIFISLALLLAGSFFYNSLNEPPTTYSYTRILENSIEYGDEMPNPLYVDGKMRDVYEVALRLIPSGQQILIADEPIEQPGFMIACSLAVIAAAPAVGYGVFRKKDLR